ncbi:putative transporter C11D3.18C [Purpureocillium lavendulum]|uniref:Transporter C11D3.18C n=1 Tax=Purpureocillium lavendulum TaxID=1247861 RepID=A0AB34FPS4_9HYPO|nr:putative transporter C11D3.18C [Purpureocillium lavendulum]
MLPEAKQPGDSINATSWHGSTDLEMADSPPFPIDPKAERRLVAKLDLVIVPVFFLIYLMAFLDRINIGNAAIMGLTQELDLDQGNRFNIALLAYYILYIPLELPSNMLLKHVRPSLYISGLMFSWGIINMCMGFVKSFGALLALRILLGGFEAGVLPGIIYITSMYYKRHELQKRVSLFFCSTSVAGAFGGLLAYALAGLGRPGMASWRWIFIVEGAITSVIAVAAAFVIIDWPHQTRYLDSTEKDLLRQRMAADIGEECRMDTLNRFTFGIILRDYKIWLAALMYLGICVAGLSTSFFMPTIIREFHWEAKEAQVRTIPVYIFGTGAMIVSAWASDRLKHRYGFIIGGVCFSSIGYSMLLAQEGKTRDYKFAAVFLVFGGACLVTPIALVWLQNNLSGHWKHAFGASVQIMVGNLAGILGSFIFLSQEKPLYPTGYGVSLGLGGLAAAVCFARQGHHVQVLERTDTLSAHGTGISIRRCARRILRSWGLEADLAAVSDEVDATRFRDIKTTDVKIELPERADHEIRHWVTTRRLAMGLLYRQAVKLGARFRFATTVVDVREDHAGASVVLANGGEVLRGDLILAADGIRSRIRAKILADVTGVSIEPLISSTTFYGIGIDAASLVAQVGPSSGLTPDRPDITGWIGSGGFIISRHSAKAGKVGLLCAIHGETDQRDLWDDRGDVGFVRDFFAGSCREVTAALDLAARCDRWKLAEMPDLPRWRSPGGRILLLGDSAHAMHPNAAHGFAQTVEDIAVLDALTMRSNPGDAAAEIPRIAEQWEAARKPRVERIKAFARTNTRVFLGEVEPQSSGTADEALGLTDVVVAQDMHAPFFSPAFTAWCEDLDVLKELDLMMDGTCHKARL